MGEKGAIYRLTKSAKSHILGAFLGAHNIRAQGRDTWWSSSVRPKLKSTAPLAPRVAAGVVGRGATRVLLTGTPHSYLRGLRTPPNAPALRANEA